MTTKEQWIGHTIQLLCQPSDYYTATRKVIRRVQLKLDQLDDSISLSTGGYAAAKLRLLEKHYFLAESYEAAVKLWESRRKVGKMGSVGFTCYAHHIKEEMKHPFGPCIQSVVVTLLDPERYTVDVFYRTTELMKKFTADVVLLKRKMLGRDQTPALDFDGMKCEGLVFHFANLTLNAMYFPSFVPSIPDPLGVLEMVRQTDNRFWELMVKATARVFVVEYRRGLEKFSQGQRTIMQAEKQVPPEMWEAIRTYCKANHPKLARSKYNIPELLEEPHDPGPWEEVCRPKFYDMYDE